MVPGGVTGIGNSAFASCGGLTDITQVTDDYGSQHGLLISPKLFNEFYRPHVQRGIDLAKSYGLIVFHHDDGDLRKLLPTLGEMGIEILNPIQWRCGNWDLADLKARYGKRICFDAGVYDPDVVSVMVEGANAIFMMMNKVAQTLQPSNLKGR